MEQRAPRLASAAKIVGTLSILASILNVKLNLFDSDGISLEEFLGFGFGLVCYITAFFAGRERKVVGLNNNLSLQEQFEMLETTPTKSGNSPTNPQSQSNHTKSIINSIIGEQALVDETTIGQAIGTLSSGDFGDNAKSIAQQLPAPHRHASDIAKPRVKNSNSESSASEVNIPLPTSINTEKSITDDESSINTLQNDSSVVEQSKIGTHGELPDVSDLFFDETTPAELPKNDGTTQDLDTPELPDLDDLF